MRRLVDTCLVLGRINFGEADRIVTVLTGSAGKQTLMAKAVRRPKSKLAGGLEIFNTNEITYIPGKKDIATLVSSRALTTRTDLIKDYQISEEAFSILKWLNDHLEPGGGAEYYQYLEGYLQAANKHSRHAYLWFFMRALEVSGQGLNPFHDEHGNKLEPANHYIFDHDASAFAVNDKGDYTQDDIKLLRLALGLEPDDFMRVVISKKQLERLHQLITRQVQFTS